ncbi:hypothetical protein NQ314_012778 [Rhamnusium bicolor]|uniref:Uncharacterized protein n=1 Tax=Rhamnusium bicolor TaxID=1586634 RepID=A0AAV8XAP3_9CUCU|nr:hypothetical protein NQ314_012778 [Rhamnusium bicolor]
MTGSKKISADSILEYFEPLYNFLKTENKKYEHYFYKYPEPEINICNLEWDERLLQNFKISRGPAFACIQKYIGWCE